MDETKALLEKILAAQVLTIAHLKALQDQVRYGEPGQMDYITHSARNIEASLDEITAAIKRESAP